jgi:hypothetical protein
MKMLIPIEAIEAILIEKGIFNGIIERRVRGQSTLRAKQ